MCILFVVLITLVTGLLGGFINRYSTSNTDPQTGKPQSLGLCILISIAATILVPLFLEIAKSELMKNITCGWGCAFCGGDIRNYFLYGGYCLLAAVAGIRFINSLMDSVIKDKKIEKLQGEVEKEKQEKEKVTKEKDNALVEKNIIEAEKAKIEAVKTKITVQNRLAAESIEEKELAALTNTDFLVRTTDGNIKLPVVPDIGEVTYPDDPQKGRFGGKAENNHRILKATVQASIVPSLYKVKIWVESTDRDRYPLDTDVIFYIHDSFQPSVYTISRNEFKDGRAMDDEILAYGAFTVGAVTDNGATLLELDLAEQPEFPKTFRER